MFLVDDAEETIEALSTVYNAHPHLQVVGFEACGLEALETIRTRQADIDIVSLDIQLGDANGMDICRQVRREFPHLFVVMCSLEADLKVQQTAHAMGANYFLAKPFGLQEINDMIQAYRAFMTPAVVGESGEAMNVDGWVNSLLKTLEMEEDGGVDNR